MRADSHYLGSWQEKTVLVSNVPAFSKAKINIYALGIKKGKQLCELTTSFAPPTDRIMTQYFENKVLVGILHIP